MEIQSDLSDRNDPGMFAQFFDGSEAAVVCKACVMRVISDSRKDHRVAVGELDGAPAVIQIGTGVDDETDTGIGGPGQHLIPVCVKFARRDMRVRVKERHGSPVYFTVAPLAMSADGLITTSFPDASDAASSMPCDSCPISLAGARLNTTTIDFPTRSSGA